MQLPCTIIFNFNFKICKLFITNPEGLTNNDINHNDNFNIHEEL